MNRLQALTLCRDFLGGAWRSIEPNQVHFEQVKGGLSNLLYLCSLPKSKSLAANEMKQVLIRKHLQIHNKLMEENVIFCVLSEREIGPKLIGVFDGGRLEEFIPSIPLKRVDMWKPDVSKFIASEMAVLHTTNMPIKKKDCWMIDTMCAWQDTISKLDFSETKRRDTESFQIVKRILKEFHFPNELEFIDNVLRNMQGRSIAFCHNDMQENNILKPFKYPHLMFIDYEYGGYNFTSFDIANHFCEWAFNYDVSVSPNFEYLPDNFPNEKEQELFIDSYIASFVMNGHMSERDGEVEKIGIREDIPRFASISHLFWGLWGIVQSEVSGIEFGYAKYAATRLNVYKEMKARYLVNNQQQNATN